MPQRRGEDLGVERLRTYQQLPHRDVLDQQPEPSRVLEDTLRCRPRRGDRKRRIDDPGSTAPQRSA